MGVPFDRPGERFNTTDADAEDRRRKNVTSLREDDRLRRRKSFAERRGSVTFRKRIQPMEHEIALSVELRNTHKHYHVSYAWESKTKKTAGVDYFSCDQVLVEEEVFTNTILTLRHKNVRVGSIVVDAFQDISVDLNSYRFI